MPPRKITNNRERSNTHETDREPETSMFGSRSTTPAPRDVEEDIPPSFDNVDELQNHGINAQDITKLKSAGLYTVGSVRMMTKKALGKIKGMSDTKVDKIKEVAAKLAGPSFCTGTELINRREKVMHIPTGSKSVDTILGGGFETQSISEVYGEFRTGKTQLCHTLCVTAQMPVSMGGTGGKVAYIDTEGTFRPQRVKAIANRFGLDPGGVQDNILYARAYNSEHQMELIQDLACRFTEEKIYRLLIIDSILALFRTDYSGRGELSERQQKLGQMLSRLVKLAEEFNIAILLTNQVQSDPGAVMSFVPILKPIGGHVLSHASTTRIFLRKGKGEERVAKVVDSPDMPETEATYKLDAGGWMDT